jgi:large repetitive protein
MAHDLRSAARQLLREARAELAQLRRIRGAHRRTARRIGRAQRRLAFAAALLAGALAQPAAALAPRFDNGAFGLANVGSSAVARFGDLDGDGDLDALVGDGSGALHYFENTSSGAQPAFADPLPNPFGLADVGQSASPALVDVDGDGDLDVFVGERYAGMFFFRNTGSAAAPSFAAPIANPFGLSDVGTRSAPAFGDVDDDGDLDLLVGELSGSHFFFRNTGNASAPAFAPAQLDPFGLVDAGARTVPALGDLDGDGDLDLLAGELYGSTYFFENGGSAAVPAFAAPVADAFGLEPLASSAAPALVDIEGDGDLDAFVGEFYGAALFFANGGGAADPAFAPAVRNPFGNASVGYAPPVAPAFADIDGDGDLDGFAGTQSGDVLFLQNTGSAAAPSLAAPVANPFGLSDVGFYAAPVFADLDGDGDLDAAVGTRPGNTLWFRNTGTAAAPAFAAPLTNPFGLADVGIRATPALADLDGDGDLDALIGNQEGNSLFFRNDGTAAAPAFAAPVTNPFGLLDVGVHASPSLADLDRDGDLDALVGERGGGTLRFTNTGTVAAPAFASPVLDADGLLNVRSFATPALADLDGDGDLDASLGGYLGRVYYFQNRELDVDACRNGVDDDGDGRTDHPSDAGCASAADISELSAVQCDNGRDDDLDGSSDWRADGSGDPQCVSLGDDAEAPTPPPPSCGLGPELLLALPLLAAARRRKLAR